MILETLTLVSLPIYLFAIRLTTPNPKDYTSPKARYDRKAFEENYRRLLHSIERSDATQAAMYRSFIAQFRKDYRGKVSSFYLASAVGTLFETLYNKQSLAA